MKRLIHFKSIDNFKRIISNMKWDYKQETLPIVTATLTEKIHGTNGGYSYSNPDGGWFQSRDNILGPDKDNAKCYSKNKPIEETWKSLALFLAKAYDIDLNEKVITLFFEWAGTKIKKGSACSGLEKRAILFEYFKVSDLNYVDKEEEVMGQWFPTKIEGTWVSANDSLIFNVMNYKTWKVDIDFEQPSAGLDKMLKILDEVEACSPLGKAMGQENNIGEGMVVTLPRGSTIQRFKIKGTKHSKSKVKITIPIDPIKEKQTYDFIHNKACVNWRLEQMWDEVFGLDNEKQQPDIKFLGDFLKVLFNDIQKEESETIKDLELNVKNINPTIAKFAKIWFINELN
jgi:hypothetical protein